MRKVTGDLIFGSIEEKKRNFSLTQSLLLKFKDTQSILRKNVGIVRFSKIEYGIASLSGISFAFQEMNNGRLQVINKPFICGTQDELLDSYDLSFLSQGKEYFNSGSQYLRVFMDSDLLFFRNGQRKILEEICSNVDSIVSHLNSNTDLILPETHQQRKPLAKIYSPHLKERFGVEVDPRIVESFEMYNQKKMSI